MDEYFNNAEEQEKKDEPSEDPIYKGYKAVLDSKSTEETLVTSLFFYLSLYRLCLVRKESRKEKKIFKKIVLSKLI